MGARGTCVHLSLPLVSWLPLVTWLLGIYLVQVIFDYSHFVVLRCEAQYSTTGIPVWSEGADGPQWFRPADRGLSHLNAVCEILLMWACLAWLAPDSHYQGSLSARHQRCLLRLPFFHLGYSFLFLPLRPKRSSSQAVFILILRRHGLPNLRECWGARGQRGTAGPAEHVQSQGSSWKQREGGGGDKPTCTDHTNPSAGWGQSEHGIS